jgi:hypothetical protein
MSSAANGIPNYLFYLWVEYMGLWQQWLKLFEDYWDIFWVKKLDE